MNEWPLYPGFSEDDKEHKDQQVNGSYDQERCCHTRKIGEPEGEGEREIHHHCHDDEKEYEC